MMEQPSFGFDEEEPEATTFSVVELNSRVRDALRRAFPDEVWVRGEVQNLSRSGAGHTYFSLVEKAVQRRPGRRAGSTSPSSATTAGPSPAPWRRSPGAELGNDVEVRIRGRVTVYPPQRPVPARDDRRSTRSSPSAGSPPTGSGCCGPSRAEGLLDANAGSRARAGAAARRP